MRNDLQYQLEKVQDFAAHLEYLQFVWLKFDNYLNKSHLICFFRNGLKHLMQVQCENEKQKLLNWENLV